MPGGKTVRLAGYEFRCVGRAAEDYAQELQEIINGLIDQTTGGIPSGFNALLPETLSLNDAGDPGAEGDGWMSASARHPLNLLLTGKGDLLSYNGAIYVRLPASTPGYVLTLDPATDSGLRWESPSAMTDDAEALAWVL